jgi:hypothetical protein
MELGDHMISRTDGAPSLPIKNEADLLWEQAVQQHAAGEISDQHLLAVAQATGRAAQVRAEIAKKFDAANARSAANLPAERAASRAAASPPEPDMTSVDTLAGDAPGTQRVWNPRTRQYDTVPKPRGMQQTVAPEPDRSIGARWGGGRPFSSTAERDEYYNRPTLTPTQKQAMIDAGATPEEIADAQASQYDKDARQSGMGTHGGYAPVWINGRVTMLPRAPTPGPVSRDSQGMPIAGGDDEYATENVSGEGSANPVPPSSDDLSAMYDFAQGMIAAPPGSGRRGIDTGADIAGATPVPLGDDGFPVVAGSPDSPAWKPGTANAATGNQSTGARAANRDVPPGLRRPDLEARGFRAMFMDGPNGGEWVYRLPETERNNARAKAEKARADRTHSRLRVQAGVVGKDEYKDAKDDQLRELIAANREARKAENETMWRARAMLQGGNAIGALALPGMNDWQLSAIRGGPTPLDVEARQADMAARMAQQAVTGFLANTPPGMTPAQQQMADVKTRQEEEGLPPDAAAARERDRNGGVLPASSRAGQRVLQEIDDQFIGTYAIGSEVDEAVEAAVARGIPRDEAEEYFKPRRKSWSEWMGGGSSGAPEQQPSPGQRPAANPWTTGGV